MIRIPTINGFSNSSNVNAMKHEFQCWMELILNIFRIILLSSRTSFRLIRILEERTKQMSFSICKLISNWRGPFEFRFLQFYYAKKIREVRMLRHTALYGNGLRYFTKTLLQNLSSLFSFNPLNADQGGLKKFRDIDFFWGPAFDF